jgi:hypothetical protein
VADDWLGQRRVAHSEPRYTLECHPAVIVLASAGFTVAPEVSNVIVASLFGAFKRFMRDPKFYKFDLNVVLVTLHNFAPSGPPGSLFVEGSWAKT